MNRREMAEENFMKGYNCAQSLVLTFADLLPYDQETLAKLASSFGGGLARLREVCGAVSGMGMVLGFLYGYEGPETGDIKMQHYARVQECALKFEEKHGSLVCRELLALSEKHQDPTPTPRTPQFYHTRVCGSFICDAAEILEEYIQNHPVE